LFYNSNVFGSCVIHILYTGRAKIKKIIPAPKGYCHPVAAYAFSLIFASLISYLQ